MLSFGISPGGKAAGEEAKDDWKDIDGEPDVKVEVDDDHIEEEDHQQEGNDDHDNDLAPTRRTVSAPAKAAERAEPTRRGELSGSTPGFTIILIYNHSWFKP